MSDLIPIEDIEADESVPVQEIIPETLRDDPVIGDGSSGRAGVNMSRWRVHTLEHDRLVGMTEYGGNDRESRNARRAQEQSREARTDKERSARLKKRVMVGSVIVFLLAIVAAVGATYALELWGGKTVPNVMGLTQANAVELLEGRGFKVEVETVLADSLEGRVVSYSPDANERVKEDTTVKLSIGQNRVIPEVVGMTRDDAKKALDDMGATNVHEVPTITLDEEEGIVREVRPGAGSVFMSTDEVTLVVSQLPRVPDIMNASEQDAVKALEEAGLPMDVAHERGSIEQRLKVMRVEPNVGERVETDQHVTVTVGEALIDPLRLTDYYDATVPMIRGFLEGEGYGLKASAKVEDKHIVARFENDKDARISLLREPWTHEADKANGVAEVLGDDAALEGVRLEVTVNREQPEAQNANEQAQNANEQDEKAQKDKAGKSKGLELLGLEKAPVDETTAQAVVERCGLGEIKGSCTQDTITLPPGTTRTGHTVYCCYGELGNRLWTVLVAGTEDPSAEAKRIVVACFPQSYFTADDLSKNGDKICGFVAYVDEYAG